jgi:polysaccharide export outer membrane protein
MSRAFVEAAGPAVSFGHVLGYRFRMSRRTVLRHTGFPVILAVLVAMGGCAQLPSSGPSARDIADETKSQATSRYRVVDVNEGVIAALRGRGDSSFAGSFGGRGGGSTEALGTGDRIAVTIWEAANGGLFSTASGQLGGGSKSTTIPEQPVSAAGTISVPYAGQIQAAGRTPNEIKASIEAALAGKAIEPQALVTVQRSVTHSVTVTGDVTNGGVVQLSPNGSRVLDVLAAAGGLSAPTHEIFVQLLRGSSTVRVPLQRIISNPRENIYLRANDVLALVRDPQTFTVLGAAGRSSEIEFSADGITANEAIAKAGGLQDSRADPGGVFVFRYEDADIVAAVDPDYVKVPGVETVPVVYRLNLRDPNGLFIAKSFRIYDKDLVYVANSAFNDFQKFAVALNAVITPVRTVSQVVNQFD